MAHQIDVLAEAADAADAFYPHLDRAAERLQFDPRVWRRGGAPLGMAKISTHRDGSYWPDRDGTPALIVPVSGSYETGAFDPVDLIAFRAENPFTLWHRTGLAPLINDEAIERARHLGGPLGVFRSPLTWLQCAMEGVVIVDWSLNLRLRFDRIVEFAFEDLETESRFHRNVSEPAMRYESFVIDDEAA